MSALASRVLCRYCDRSIVVAVCADGRRRAFDPALDAGPAPTGVWVWRRGRGMSEVDDHAGHRLHWCSQFHRVLSRPVTIGDPNHPRGS